MPGIFASISVSVTHWVHLNTSHGIVISMIRHRNLEMLKALAQIAN